MMLTLYSVHKIDYNSLNTTPSLAWLVCCRLMYIFSFDSGFAFLQSANFLGPRLVLIQKRQ